MGTLSYIVSGSGKITAVANGQPYTVAPDHVNYQKIKACLKAKDADNFIKFVDVPKTIESFSKGKVRVVNGTVTYNDKEINNSLTKRIIWMLNEGFDIDPLVKFLENLMQNPSRRAVNELYTWMENQDIPITVDGCWIGYKYLNSIPKDTLKRLPDEPKDKDIYLDVHSGTIRQWIGKVITMPRNEVDEDWGVACSEGLHVGSSTYTFSGDVRVLVKVNPKDVVSVPSNETNKCRVCSYEIVSLYEKTFDTPVVGAKAEYVAPTNNSYADEDECEYCDGECDGSCDNDECEYCGYDDCDGECIDEE